MLGFPFDSLGESTLVFLHTRINLSPFTKDFRGGEQLNESLDQFFVALPSGGAPIQKQKIIIAPPFQTINWCADFEICSFHIAQFFSDACALLL